MRRLELSPEAFSDLSAIARYSQRKWGRARRDAYMATLVVAMNRLRVHELGRPRDDIMAGVWSHRSGRHVILFRRDGELVRILSVTHERRDLSSMKFEGVHEKGAQFAR